MAKQSRKASRKGSRQDARQQNKKQQERPAKSGIRPFWSGTISFGLVTVPVDLYPAKRSSRASLRMLAPDGTPVERRYWCPKHETDVHPEHILRGYEYEPGEYVIVRDEELEAASPKKSREIDLRQFIDLSDIHPVFFERPYFLLPAGDTAKAYLLLTDVMQSSRKAGIATFVMRNKEYLVAILAENGILRAETLRFVDELRDPEQANLPERGKAEAKRVKQFETSIRKATTKTLPTDQMQDTYSDKLRKLAEQKRRKKSGAVVKQERPSAAGGAGDNGDDEDEVVAGQELDLLDVIKQRMQSLSPGGNGDAKKKSSKKSSPRGRRSEGRSESQRRDDYQQQNKQELYELAKKQDIAGRSQMTKDELIEALREKNQ